MIIVSRGLANADCSKRFLAASNQINHAHTCICIELMSSPDILEALTKPKDKHEWKEVEVGWTTTQKTP